jgi:hypothetical protein
MGQEVSDMVRRLISAAVLGVTFLAGSWAGPSLVSEATAQQGGSAAMVIGTILGGAENGGATIELLYDDTNMRATGVQVTNNLPDAIYVEILRDSDHLIYSQRFPGQLTSVINIPTTPAGRINLTMDARGRLRGYWAGISYPVP